MCRGGNQTHSPAIPTFLEEGLSVSALDTGDLEMVLLDEAWSGAKDQDEEEGLPALNCVMRKAVSQGFGDFVL